MSTTVLLLLSLASADASSSPRGILYDFSASWCQPCQQMSPIVAKLEREGLPIRTIDIDQNRKMALAYGIGPIPAFVLVIDGKVVDYKVGATDEYVLRQMIARIPQGQPSTPDNGGGALLASRGQPQRTPPKQKEVRVKDAVLVDGNGTRTPSSKSLFQLPALPPLFRKQRDVAIDETAEAAHEPAVFRGNIDASPPASAVPRTATPLDSSTRIRVKDEDGINFGSGTIIESRPGRTVVLTCGHIFRQLKKDSTIEVDVFTEGQAESYIGTLIDFDAEADVGLIAIPTGGEVPKARVASAANAVRKGEPVVSVGCGGGEAPTEQKLTVTLLNRYLGPDNIECTGVPIQGRSGGGLFNAAGQVVGVCIAADPENQRGLYSGLQCVHSILKRAGFAYLIDGAPAGAAVAAAGNVAGNATGNSADVSPELVEASELESRQHGEAAGGADEGSAVTPLEAELASMQQTDGGARGSRRGDDEFDGTEESAATQDALAAAGEAEVICIIRPLGKPNAASRVVVINRASSKFVSYLKGEVQRQPHPTMRTIERVRPARRVPRIDDEQNGDADLSARLRERVSPPGVERDEERPAEREQYRRAAHGEETASLQPVMYSAARPEVVPRRYRRSPESR